MSDFDKKAIPKFEEFSKDQRLSLTFCVLAGLEEMERRMKLLCDQYEPPHPFRHYVETRLAEVRDHAADIESAVDHIRAESPKW